MRRQPSGGDAGGACLLLILLIVVPAMINSCMSSDSGGDYTPTYAPYAPLPTPSFAPYTGPVTVCRDGWISHSTGRGTCSHHGGEG